MNEPLTQEEIDVLKEVAKDRMATTRVIGKIKNIALFLTAIVAAYILVIENAISWLRFKLGV